MIFDSHSHTNVSSDSKMTAEEAIAAAERQGVGLVFTEHYDVDYLDNFHYTNMDFRFDAKKYWEKYEPLRGDKLYLGVEMGMVDGTSAHNREFVKQVPFDLVIGSTHNIDRYDLYFPDWYEGKTKDQAFLRYFAEMDKLLREHDYIDVMGHIDYICRYAPYENKEIQYGEYSEAIDKVLKTLLELDVVMELNTRRLGDRLALKELVPVYKRYAELGGKYVTLGSDGHNKDAIGVNFKIGEEFADELGLQIVTFKERKMQKCK